VCIVRDGLAVAAAVWGDGAEHLEMDRLVFGEKPFACRVAMQQNERRAAAVLPIGDLYLSKIQVLGG